MQRTFPVTHRWRTLLLWVLLLTACQPIQPSAPTVAPAVSPTVGSVGLGDPLFPTAGNGGIDVLAYLLEISWDDESKAIYARATLNIEAAHALTAFNLDFYGLTVAAITVNGESARFQRTGDEVTITLPSLIDAGDQFTVAVAYQGVPEEVPESVGDGWITTAEGVVVLSEPVGAKNWFPSNNHPTDKATYTFRITVPSGYSVAANGIATDPVNNGDTGSGDTGTGDTRRYEFVAREPMATYLATVNIGQFEREEHISDGGIPIVNYFFASGTAQNRAPFARQDEMLDYFSTRFGPYPFAVAGAIQVEQELNVALETQTRAVYGAETAETVVAHELAHQWFGDYVSIDSWDEVWLKEGFATYGEWLWLEESQGREARDALIVAIYQGLVGTAQPPAVIQRAGPAAMYNPGVYRRGALTLHALRLRVGDATFFAILQDFVARFGNDAAGTEDFIAVAEAVSGDELDDFFHAWLVEPQMPDLPELGLSRDGER